MFVDNPRHFATEEPYATIEAPVMESRTYYDVLAENFEQENEFWDNPYDNEIWRLEHDIIRPYLDIAKPLLDLGCGFYPHDNFSPAQKIVAGDISTRSLQVARDHSSKLRIDFVAFDAHALPFQNASFSQAIAGGELFNHLDYRALCNELARVISANGFLLVEFGAKWCLDSLWAILDSQMGNHIGYSLTRSEARAFFTGKQKDAAVTWEVTPRGDLAVKLLTPRNVRRALENSGFIVRKVISTNLISGLVPLPWQQDPDRKVSHILAKVLIRFDGVLGRIPGLNRFAGNIFFLCNRKPSETK